MVDPALGATASSSLAPVAGDVRAAWRVSRQSILWTVVASTAAIAVGVADRSGALVAFGAIGFVDAIGSSVLAYHFGHAMRHERISLRGERLAHRVVVVGLVTVGSATIVVDASRLAVGVDTHTSLMGVGLAAVSVPVLTALALRKRSVARRVASAALRADGHLSAVGATLASITLAGTAANQIVGWQWADAAAAIAVGCIAVRVGLQSWLAR